MIEVNQFGIHWSEDVAFLMQEGTSDNAVGSDIPCPFIVKPPVRLRCPHRIVIQPGKPSKDFIDKAAPVLKRKAFRPFLPVPKPLGEPPFFVGEGQIQQLLRLSFMSHPVTPLVVSHIGLTNPSLLHQCKLTNISPLIIKDISVRDSIRLAEMARLVHSTPRTVIFTGSDWTIVPPEVVRLNLRAVPGVELIKSIGPFVVKEYMQKGFDRGTHKFFEGKSG